LPDYARFDVRLAKSFPKDRYRITLFVEVLNLLDRDNVSYSGYEFAFVNPETGRIRNLTLQQFPIFPTAGIMFVF
jgi:outer membrane receptor protein involved in Fe transport